MCIPSSSPFEAEQDTVAAAKSSATSGREGSANLFKVVMHEVEMLRACQALRQMPDRTFRLSDRYVALAI
jgi:hypothetical protein